MAIDLSQDRETINKQIIDALARRINRGDGVENVLTNLVESVIGHQWVDEELERSLQDTMAGVAGEETINNPDEEDEDDDN